MNIDTLVNTLFHVHRRTLEVSGRATSSLSHLDMVQDQS
jgi:hypothetical protein